jgi:DNA-binding beta-propeller fold protein YncE
MKAALAACALLGLLAGTTAAPVPRETRKGSGILVFDDSDRVFSGKQAYEDNLTFLGTDGKVRFHVSGFNNCQTISGTRQVATDPARKSIWVVEVVDHRVLRFDLAGKEQVRIDAVKGSAVAVDPDTGNVWVGTGDGEIGGKGEILVFAPDGKKVAAHPVNAWDIVYDPKAKAFWAAEQTLTKLAAKDGKVLVRTKLSGWCATSLAPNPATGDVWVGIRDQRDRAHELIRFDAAGEAKATVALAGACPWRVAADPKSGTVWTTVSSRGVRGYSPAGKLVDDLKVDGAIAVEIDPNGDGLWVVTRDDTRLLSFAGKELRKVDHKKPTDQAWIAVYKE